MRLYVILPPVLASLLMASPQTKAPFTREANNLSPALRLSTQRNVGRQHRASLCRKDEQVLFSCKTAGSKIISLCGSKQLSAKNGYLQYRFGKVGALELQFPQKLENTQAAFRYDHYFRYRVDRTQITFENGGYRYRLSDFYEGDMTPEVNSASVDVTPTGKEGGVEIDCRSRVLSRLGTLESVIPTIEDSELNPD